MATDTPQCYVKRTLPVL